MYLLKTCAASLGVNVNAWTEDGVCALELNQYYFLFQFKRSAWETSDLDLDFRLWKGKGKRKSG